MKHEQHTQTKEIDGTPQYCIPRDCPYWKTYDNPEQENIQGVEIHPVKINFTKGKNPDVMDTSGNNIG